MNRGHGAGDRAHGKVGKGGRAKPLLLQSDYLVQRNCNTYLVSRKFCVRALATARTTVNEKARRFWSRAYLPKRLR
jgi:hypothetical protein